MMQQGPHNFPFLSSCNLVTGCVAAAVMALVVVAVAMVVEVFPDVVVLADVVVCPVCLGRMLKAFRMEVLPGGVPGARLFTTSVRSIRGWSFGTLLLPEN